MTENVAELEIIGLPPLPEVRPGDDLAGFIGDAIEAAGVGLRAGDVLVVTQKVISKAEGRLVDLRTIEPSPFARDIAQLVRQVEISLECWRIHPRDHSIYSLAIKRIDGVVMRAGWSVAAGEAPLRRRERRRNPTGTSLTNERASVS